MTCLDLKNKEVREWIDLVGLSETYKQLIEHNYSLPTVKEFEKNSKEPLLNLKQVKDLYDTLFVSSDEQYESLKELKVKSPTTQAAFWNNMFYFNNKIDKRQAYEEAFHKIFQTLTTAEEKEPLIKLGRELLKDRLKKQGISFKNHLAEQSKNLNLKGTILENYLIEEEIAKEYVNYSTYAKLIDSTVTDTISSRVTIFPFEVLNDLTTSLLNFFKKLFNIQKTYNQNKEVLHSYFSNINSGKFLDTQVLQDGSYPIPSYSPLFIEKDDNVIVFNISEQRRFYNTAVDIMRQLKSHDPYNEEKEPLSTEDFSEKAIDIFKSVYKKSNSQNDRLLVESLEDVENGEYFLDDTLPEFEESENRKRFKADITDLFNKSKLTQLEDLEALEEAEESGTTFYEDTSDKADQKDYFKSFSKMIKIYLSTIPVSTEKVVSRTLYTAKGNKQQFKIKVRHLVDPLKIYASTVKVTANSNNTLTRLKKLILFASDSSNAEMNAFVDKFLFDVFLKDPTLNKKSLLASLKPHILSLTNEEELSTRPEFQIQSMSLFQTLNKSFNLFTRDYRMYFIDNEGKGIVTKMNPSHRNTVDIQLSSWQSNWETSKYIRFDKNQDVFTRGFGANFSKKYLEITDQDKQLTFLNKQVSLTVEFFDYIGVSLSDNYIKWIIADSIVKVEGTLPNTYQLNYDGYSLQEDSIFDLDSIGGLAAEINKQNVNFVAGIKESELFDPFYEAEDSDKKEGMIGRLKKAARGNAFFDENVVLSSFLDSDNKMRYGHQHQTILLNFAHNILSNEELFNKYKESLGDFKTNPLINFYNSLSKEERLNLKVFSSLGITKQKISETGSLQGSKDKKSTVNEVNPDLFITNNINVALGDYIKKGNSKFIPYHVSTLESSNTNSYFTGTWFGERESFVVSDAQKGKVKRLTDNTIINKKGEVGTEGLKLFKELVDQEATRITKEKSFLQEFLDANKGELQTETFENGESTSYYKVNITEENLRNNGDSYKLENIIKGYHTGDVYLDEDLNLHQMNFSKGKIARALVFSQSLEGIIDNNVKLLYYEQLKSNDKTNEIENALKSSINSLLDLQLNEINLTIKDVDNIFYRAASSKKNIDKQKDLGLYTGGSDTVNFNLNSKIFFLNEMINKISFNRLLFNDFAINNKNEPDDYSKRIKALESNIISVSYKLLSPSKGINETFTNLKMVQMIEAADVKDDVSSVQKDKDRNPVYIDSDDAQTISSTEHFRKISFGLGRLTNKMTHLLNKISEGVELTNAEKKDTQTLEFYNILKVRGYGKDNDLKTGSFFTSKRFTASSREIPQEVYDENGIDYYSSIGIKKPKGIRNSFTVPKKGATKLVTKEVVNHKIIYREWYDDGTRTYLFDKMLLLEGWRKIDDQWKFQGNEYKIDVLSPTSAHKRKKQNVWNGNANNFVDEIHNQNIDIENENLYGLQVENPSGKKEMSAPTQEQEIITSEINGTVKIFDKDANLISTLDKEKIIKTYEALSAKRSLNNWDLVINDVLDEKDQPHYKHFWKTVQEGLLDTGGDQQSINFLNLNEFENEATGETVYNPEYNGNIPIVKNKIEQMIFSFFSKGVLKQKRAGESKAMFSPRGIGLLKKLVNHTIDGKQVTTWKEVQKGSDEFNENIEFAQKNNFVQKGLTFNGKDEDPDFNTLLLEFNRMNENGDVYFIDELRHLKPRIKNNTITGYYSEAIMGAYNADQVGIQESYKYMSGVRIPSQDKGTSANIEWVEMMGYEYGNSIAIAKEIQELSGSDFDIDKLFVSYPEGFWEGGVFIPFENNYNPTVMFEWYIKYLTEKPKSLFNKRIKEELKDNIIYNDIKGEVEYFKFKIKDSLNYYNELISNLYEDNKINYLTKEETLSELDDIKNSIDNYKESDEFKETIDLLKTTQAKISNIRKNLKSFKEKKTNSELKLAQLNIDLSKLKHITEQKVLRELNLPHTVELYMEDIYVNNGLVNNELLIIKQALLTHNYSTYSRPTDVAKLKNLDGSRYGILNRSDYKDSFNLSPFTSLYQRNYRRKILAASTGISSSVNANLVGLVLTRLGVELNDSNVINITYEKDEKVIKNKHSRFTEEMILPPGVADEAVLEWLSPLITATTDEAKEGVLAFFNLFDQGLDVFATGLLLGIHPEILITIVNHPQIQSAIKRVKRDPLSLDKIESIESILSEFRIPEEESYELSLDDDLDTQSVVETFMRIYEISKQNSDLVKYIRLKRGYGATYDDFNKIIKAGLALRLDNEKLGLDFYSAPLIQDMKESVHNAYDLPYYLDKNKDQVALMWSYMKDIVPKTSKVLGKYLIEGSDNYKTIHSHMTKVSSVPNFKTEEFKKEVFIAIIGRMLKSSTSYNLDASLIFDAGSPTLGVQYLEILNELKDDETIVNSILFKKLLPKLGATKRKEKNDNYIISSDYTDTFSLKIFSKMSPEMQSDLMDEYFSLSKHPNEKVRKFLKNLFSYYIIKDAMFYSPSGISKIFPNDLFKPLSDSMDKFMSQPIEELERNLRVIEHKILTDVRNKDYVKQIPPIISIEGNKVNTYFRNGGLVSIRKSSKDYHIEEELVKKNIITKSDGKFYFPEVIKIGGNYYTKVNNGLTTVDYVLTPLFGTENFHSSITQKTIVSPLENLDDIISELKEGINSVNTRKLPNFVKDILKGHLTNQIENLEGFMNNKSANVKTDNLTEVESGEEGSQFKKVVETSDRKFTPNEIISLSDKEFFIFGSNDKGNHGAGAAKLAKDKFGAKQNQSEGLQGQTFGIITKLYQDGKLTKYNELTPENKIKLKNLIKKGIKDLNLLAEQNPNNEYLVTKIGSNLAGFTENQMRQFFEIINKETPLKNNIILPKSYEVRDDLKETSTSNVKPVEINSYADNLEFALTNPTHTSPKGSDWSRDWTDSQTKWRKYLSKGIVFNGVTYKDTEEAYQKNKKDYLFEKDLFNQERETTFDLMVDLIKIKLRTYPKLVEGINKKGGLSYLQNATHQPTKQNSFWETKGGNGFIKALTNAYKDITEESEENTSENPIDC
jgi:hypothetical protein